MTTSTPKGYIVLFIEEHMKPNTNKILYKETGRSMVEMLGVLAIIGVLSIGGIAGYTMSMRKHRANQVADALNKYALIIYGICQKYVIDGDLTHINSCHKKTYPTYQESGLSLVPDINFINILSIGESSKTDYNPNEKIDSIILDPYFNNRDICKTAANITGSSSEHQCNQNPPHYTPRIFFK